MTNTQRIDESIKDAIRFQTQYKDKIDNLVVLKELAQVFNATVETSSSKDPSAYSYLIMKNASSGKEFELSNKHADKLNEIFEGYLRFKHLLI